ncbi:MAG TPA: hypothetical protein VMU32_06830 [Solirubrobacteraceae bacterium]|nr:hypothetical protein [Solirubrobacteraceae bacterium]
MTHTRRAPLAALCMALALIFSPWRTPMAAAVQITEFSPFPAGGEPAYVTTGPDGNLWVTNKHADEIERVNTEGQRTGEFQIPQPEAEPYDIVSGPDGLLWFTELKGDGLGTVSTSGEVDQIYLGEKGSTLGIVPGREGDVWVSGSEASFIAHVFPSIYAILPQPFSPGLLAMGPEGNVWFTDNNTEEVGLFEPPTLGAMEWEPPVSPTQCVAQPVLQKCPFLDAIAAGPDGALWYSEFEGRSIGRITPSGERSEFSTGLSEPSGINSFAVGPEGNLWFTEAWADRVGWITPAGAISEVSSGISPGAYPYDITLGPEDNLWFTESAGDRLGRIIPNVPPIVTTGAAGSVTTDSAALAGTVRSRGAETTYSFQYGTSASYGSTTATASNGAGDDTQAVTAGLAGLAPATTYHYRIVASNTNGVSYGGDETFTTAAAPPPPPLPPAPRVTVGPFEMYFAGFRAGHGRLHLTKVVVLDVARGDRVSYVCNRCAGSSTRAARTAAGGQVAFRTRALVVSARSSLEVLVKGPDGSRRMRTYGFLIGPAEVELHGQRCYLPGARTPVPCPGSARSTPGRHRRRSVKRRDRAR